MTHEEQLERRRARYHERYVTDLEFRAHVLEKGREWSLSNRPKRAARTARWRAANRDRVRAQDRVASALRRRRDPAVREDARRRAAEWNAAHPERRRVTVLARHRMTAEEYEALLAVQGGACAICRQPETGIRRGHLMRLAVDHHHGTGVRRGLLCNQCNRGLGSFADDPDLLVAAARYLTTHQKEVAA